ncbi:hypothetical protein [Planotetraspora kaengkrachanensis]|nr:hypothetical protein [Planotetraspora kaengkrachanensis]
MGDSSTVAPGVATLALLVKVTMAAVLMAITSAAGVSRCVVHLMRS